MRNLVWVGVGLLLLLVACESPLFSATDEADIRISISEAMREGQLSTDKGLALLELLDDVQNPVGWEAWAGSILGLLGTFFGVRAQRQLAQRPRTLADPRDIELLQAMLTKERVGSGVPAPGPTP